MIGYRRLLRFPLPIAACLLFGVAVSLVTFPEPNSSPVGTAAAAAALAEGGNISPERLSALRRRLDSDPESPAFARTRAALEAFLKSSDLSSSSATDHRYADLITAAVEDEAAFLHARSGARVRWFRNMAALVAALSAFIFAGLYAGRLRLEAEIEAIGVISGSAGDSFAARIRGLLEYVEAGRSEQQRQERLQARRAIKSTLRPPEPPPEPKPSGPAPRKPRTNSLSAPVPRVPIGHSIEFSLDPAVGPTGALETALLDRVRMPATRNTVETRQPLPEGLNVSLSPDQWLEEYAQDLVETDAGRHPLPPSLEQLTCSIDLFSRLASPEEVFSSGLPVACLALDEDHCANLREVHGNDEPVLQVMRYLVGVLLRHQVEQWEIAVQGDSILWMLPRPEQGGEFGLNEVSGFIIPKYRKYAITFNGQELNLPALAVSLEVPELNRRYAVGD